MLGCVDILHDSANIKSLSNYISTVTSPGVLLPVFAILMKRVEKVENVNTRIQKLFRNFWEICVVMNFVTKGSV